MTPTKKSWEIRTIAISKRFQFCSKNKEWTIQEDCIPGIFFEGTFQVYTIEQYGRQDKSRSSSVIEACGKFVYQSVVDVAQKAGVAIAMEDTSLCHRLQTWKLGQKVSVAKFVRGHTKHNNITYKNNDR